MRDKCKWKPQDRPAQQAGPRGRARQRTVLGRLRENRAQTRGFRGRRHQQSLPRFPAAPHPACATAPSVFTETTTPERLCGSGRLCSGAHAHLHPEEELPGWTGGPSRVRSREAKRSLCHLLRKRRKASRKPSRNGTGKNIRVKGGRQKTRGKTSRTGTWPHVRGAPATAPNRR